MTPTILTQYHLNLKGNVSLYTGVGLNYSLFFNDDLIPAVVSELGASNHDIEAIFGSMMDTVYVNIDITLWELGKIFYNITF